jgi:SNF2 family DNA or RNA helicase
MKIYGTIKYNSKRKSWEIECEPHVSIRLKRVFGKADKHEHGVIFLSATPENSRDLQWFLQRYPMDVVDTKRLIEQAGEFRERASLIDRLLSGMGTVKPFDLKLPLRDYQTFAANMWLTAGGLLLADDVGLGKTAVAIAGLTDPRLRPALVVCPTHMPTQWIEQVNKFVDGITCHKLKTASPYDLIKACNGKFPDVIISNYHKLDGWARTISPLIKSVIFDEVQELRHRTSNKYNAAKHIAKSVEFRLGLSATPIYNYGGEIYNVLSALSPGKLGTWEEFEREWCGYQWGKPTIHDPKAFGVYARETGLMLRRTRKDVGRELPPITIIPHTIETDTTVLDRMEGQAIELAKTILKQKQSFRGEIMQAAGEFDVKLRQATGIAKAPFVADFVRFIVENDNEQVVLFGWHREVYNIWMERLRDLNPVMYTGSESPTQKDEAKLKFISGESKVIMISLRAGAGVDGLQDVAHIAVVGELDYSPGVHEQNLGRLYRDGQLEGVIAYFLLSESGSDPVISDILGLKKQQIEGLRDPNQELVTKLQIQGDHIKKLAARYLADRGIELPPTSTEETTSETATNLVS